VLVDPYADCEEPAIAGHEQLLEDRRVDRVLVGEGDASHTRMSAPIRPGNSPSAIKAQTQA